MSDQNIPKIEDEIREFLEGEVQETALEFAAYLNENNMTPQQWFCPTIWKTPYGKYYFFGIFLNQKGKFRIYFYRCDYKGEFDEGFLKPVHDHVRPCVDCGGDCPKGMNMTIFGKEFPNTCFQFPIQFENPDGDTLEHIKKLIEYWKVVAPDNTDKLHVLG
jgi:hypothetical protein